MRLLDNLIRPRVARWLRQRVLPWLERPLDEQVDAAASMMLRGQEEAAAEIMHDLDGGPWGWRQSLTDEHMIDQVIREADDGQG